MDVPYLLLRWVAVDNLILLFQLVLFDFFLLGVVDLKLKSFSLDDFVFIFRTHILLLDLLGLWRRPALLASGTSWAFRFVLVEWLRDEAHAEFVVDLVHLQFLLKIGIHDIEVFHWGVGKLFDSFLYLLHALGVYFVNHVLFFSLFVYDSLKFTVSVYALTFEIIEWFNEFLQSLLEEGGLIRVMVINWI